MKFSVTFYILIGFIVGAAISCLLSIFQSILMGTDYLLLRSYIMPSSMGAIYGVIISFLWYRSNKILFEKLDIEKMGGYSSIISLEPMPCQISV